MKKHALAVGLIGLFLLQSCTGEAAAEKQNDDQFKFYSIGQFKPALCPGEESDDTSQDKGGISFGYDGRASLYVYNGGPNGDQQIEMANGEFLRNQLNVDDDVSVSCFSGEAHIESRNCKIEDIRLQNCQYKDHLFKATYVTHFFGDGHWQYRKGTFAFRFSQLTQALS